MEKKTEAFIFASSEIQEILLDNGVTLVELLEQEDYEINKTINSNPGVFEDEYRTKELATTILASAAFIAVLTPIILKVIQSLTYKQVVVHEMVLIPVLGVDGKVITDISGEPKLQWVKRARLLESSIHESKQEISIKAFGFEIEIENSVK